MTRVCFRLQVQVELLDAYRERHAAVAAPPSIPAGHARIADATGELARALALDPWVERVAVVLDDVVPDRDGDAA